MDTELLAPAYPIFASALNGYGSSTTVVTTVPVVPFPHVPDCSSALKRRGNQDVTMTVPPLDSPRTTFHGTWVIAVTVLVLACGMLTAFGTHGHAVAPARHAVPSTSTAGANWTPPVEGANPSSVVREFQGPSAPWGAGHRGIDLSASSEVVAPDGGTVRFVGTVVDRPVLTIEHDNGMLSSFEPVATELSVGDVVRRGQVLGSLSGEQHCEVSCVHWGVRIPDGWTIGSTVRDRYIDPGLLLGWSGPSVLWPLQGSPFR